MVEVRKATVRDLDGLAKLAFMLWPTYTLRTLIDEITLLLLSRDCAFFVVTEQAKVLAFAQVDIRTDYVKGISSLPMGHLKGVFIEPDFRGRGFAYTLMSEAEMWAWQRGCKEMGSDCVQDNEASIDFHKKLGFTESNRVIAFAKTLTKQKIIPKTNITGIYQHFKGQQYEVLGIGKCIESGEDFVVYQQLYAPFDFWLRPYEMFFGESINEGKSIVRFKKTKSKYVHVPITPRTLLRHSENASVYKQVSYHDLVYNVMKI